jgi:hypothetical protein
MGMVVCPLQFALSAEADILFNRLPSKSFAYLRKTMFNVISQIM